MSKKEIINQSRAIFQILDERSIIMKEKDFKKDIEPKETENIFWRLLEKGWPWPEETGVQPCMSLKDFLEKNGFGSFLNKDTTKDVNKDKGE